MAAVILSAHQHLQWMKIRYKYIKIPTKLAPSLLVVQTLSDVDVFLPIDFTYFLYPLWFSASFNLIHIKIKVY